MTIRISVRALQIGVCDYVQIQFSKEIASKIDMKPKHHVSVEIKDNKLRLEYIGESKQRIRHKEKKVRVQTNNVASILLGRKRFSELDNYTFPKKISNLSFVVEGDCLVCDIMPFRGKPVAVKRTFSLLKLVGLQNG